MVTRGKKINIDPSLIPHTRDENRIAKEKNILQIQKAKDDVEAEKNRKATTAYQHIAQVEDARVLEEAQRHSLRPDIDLEHDLPVKPRPVPRPVPKVRENPGTSQGFS